MRRGIGLGPIFLLCTGVVITVTSQWVVDADFADKSAHVVPWVKFSSTLLYALVSRRSAPTPQPTARQLRLMGLVGLLDAAAYTTYCVGFYICGATLSGILLPGLSQVLTATATRFVLGRHLSRGQALGISCVLAGLATRALPPELFGQTSTAGAAGVASKAAGSAEEREQLLGAGLIALSAVLYSGLGIAYDKLVRGAGEKPPPHADVMWHTSKLGFLAASAYQLLYTLPRYEELVGRRMAASGVHPLTIVSLLCLLGGSVNLHTFAQSLVFKSDGAVAVQLTSAVRGAVLAVCMGLWFCSPARPKLCLTPQTIVSAAITTLGGVIWVLSGARATQPQPAGVDKPKAE